MEFRHAIWRRCLPHCFPPGTAEYRQKNRPRSTKKAKVKGKEADDSKIGKIVEGLVGMVPSAIGTVVSMFASPILGGIVGPVTKFVLDRFQQE